MAHSVAETATTCYHSEPLTTSVNHTYECPLKFMTVIYGMEINAL